MPPKQPPSEALLKRRRRKTPIFSDESIQWHLYTSKHDQCPWCGFTNVGYLGRRKRSCMNSSCHITMSRDEPSTEFLRDKLEGEEAINYSRPAFEIIKVDGGRKKLLAQKESRDKRALLTISHGGFTKISIYWHIDGHSPEDGEGHPAMKIGSPYWYWIISLTHYGDGCPHWQPAEPLNPLEVLARAGTDDPVYFARV